MRANRIPRIHGARAHCRTPATGWPLADWADQRPHTRWPLIALLLALLCGLAGNADLPADDELPACDAACAQTLAADEVTT